MRIFRPGKKHGRECVLDGRESPRCLVSKSDLPSADDSSPFVAARVRDSDISRRDAHDARRVVGALALVVCLDRVGWVVDEVRLGRGK